MNQKGFATLEVIMMVVVIGILATIAVPRFTDVTTKANTAKIQSDLSTIDTAIQMYYMEKNSYPSQISDLVDNGYLMDEPKPPTGKAYMKNSDDTSTKFTAQDINSTATSYGINTKGRATLDSKTAGDFGLSKSQE